MNQSLKIFIDAGGGRSGLQSGGIKPKELNISVQYLTHRDFSRN